MHHALDDKYLEKHTR
jgi:staphylococcal nuclease domain-containing protein 1